MTIEINSMLYISVPHIIDFEILIVFHTEQPGHPLMRVAREQHQAHTDRYVRQ